MIRLLALLFLLLAAPVAGHAQPAAPAAGVAAANLPPLDDAVALLASEDFDDIRKGVDALATSGHPRATILLGALQDGRLYVSEDRKLFLKNADDTYADALTGEAEPEPEDVHAVGVNNSIRRAVDAALGALRLFAPDAATRATAAEAVFKSRDPAGIPALDRAIAKETDAGVKRTMQQARAAALFAAGNASEADRLAAVATLRDRGDIDARALLANLTDQPPSVVDAAAAAVKSIDFSLQLWSVLQSVYYGLSLGSVLLLAAAGLAITFGVMGVINMAHGEMVMIGAYVTFVVQQLIRAYAPGLFGASLFFAVPLAFLVAGAIGIAIERSLIRWLYGRPLETLLATWGLSLLLQQAVRSIFGADQPGGRHAGMDERRDAARRAVADL